MSTQIESSAGLKWSPEVRAAVAYRRARGASWEEAGAAVRHDPDALRWAATADPEYAAALEAAWADVMHEAEAAAIRRLCKLTESADEKVALRAATVIVRHADRRRRDQARADEQREWLDDDTNPNHRGGMPTRAVESAAPRRVVEG